VHINALPDSRRLAGAQRRHEQRREGARLARDGVRERRTVPDGAEHALEGLAERRVLATTCERLEPLRAGHARPDERVELLGEGEE
jgi:hypothetical protein